MKIGVAAAHLPGPDLRAAAVLGGPGLRDPAARATWRWAPAPSTPPPSCAPSGRSPGARPMCSLRGGPPTAATARTRSASSTTTSSRWSSNPRRSTSSICTSAACARSGSIRWCTTSASSRTTGSPRRWAPGAWAGKSGLNGMEITQFTYFQQVGGLDCKPVTGEITYGLERLAMYLQSVESLYDIVWTDGPLGPRHLSRRVPPERSGAVGLQLRARGRRRAVPALRRAREGLQRSARREARAAGVRADAEGLAHLQSARCAHAPSR